MHRDGRNRWKKRWRALAAIARPRDTQLDGDAIRRCARERRRDRRTSSASPTRMALVVTPRGSGTKLGWGNPVAPRDSC